MYTTGNVLNSSSNLPQRMHNALCASRPQNDVFSSAKWTHAILELPKPSSKTPSDCLGCVTLPKFFRPFHHVLHPSWTQDDVSSSANRSHITRQLPEPLHLVMSLPSLETMYRCPLNALSTCWPVFPAAPQRPASLLGPRRRIVVRKSVPHHPPASGTLRPRHEPHKLRNDVSLSAKRPLYVLANFPTVPQRPASLLAPRQRIVVRKSVPQLPDGFHLAMGL